MKEQILFVHGDPNILEGYRPVLRMAVQEETAEGGQEGLKALAEKGYLRRVDRPTAA